MHRGEEWQVENKLWLPEGKGGQEGYREIGVDTYMLLYTKYITNKDLLYSTGNSTQYSIMTYMEIESKKRMDICITDSLCCISEAYITL